MRRRVILAAAPAALVAPRIARSQATRVLRFIPRADLGDLDPHTNSRPEMAAACLLVWDTLYGVDSRLEPQPQMCEGHEVSDDRRIWTFRLRHGLTFHDGTNVTARDAVASLQRWMLRDRMGQAIATRLAALEALDDRSFRFTLRQPFGPMLFALGKTTAPLAVVMPERLARTDAFQSLPEAVGSGPMRLRIDGDEGLVFERVADYAVRPEGADWLAGGKRVLFERIEWTHAPPDAATAAEAIQNGSADWWEAPTPETVPLLKRNRNVLVDIADPLGCVGTLRLNHRQAPFDDVRARRAVLLAVSQDACMTALSGGDDALWKAMPGVFTPGTPLAVRVAAQMVAAGEVTPPRDLDAARRLLADVGCRRRARRGARRAAWSGARSQAVVDGQRAAAVSVSLPTCRCCRRRPSAQGWRSLMAGPLTPRGMTARRRQHRRLRRWTPAAAGWAGPIPQRCRRRLRTGTRPLRRRRPPRRRLPSAAQALPTSPTFRPGSSCATRHGAPACPELAARRCRCSGQCRKPSGPRYVYMNITA